MRYFFMFLIILLTAAANAQETAAPARMSQDQLQDLILEVGSDVFISGNVVRFTYDGAELLCVTDESADRMRIVSPIIELSAIDSEQLLLALAANFHTVLDARYAISDGIVYAAFIHPLGALSTAEVLSAIRQVATASNTFGDAYSSGELLFGGGAG